MKFLKRLWYRLRYIEICVYVVSGIEEGVEKFQVGRFSRDTAIFYVTPRPKHFNCKAAIEPREWKVVKL